MLFIRMQNQKKAKQYIRLKKICKSGEGKEIDILYIILKQKIDVYLVNNTFYPIIIL